MTLEPLLHAPAAIQFHVATVVPAAILGTWQIFFSRKGAPLHRAIGYVYLALMSVTALSTLWIHRIMPDKPFWGFSPIHLLSVFTLVMLPLAVWRARWHQVEHHRRAMMSLFLGALVIAGAFTLLPGRIMHEVVFGSG